jgi:Na+/proline symporter
MVLVGILWIPIIKNMQGAQLYIYIQSVAAYFSPPIAAIYLLAILWKKANEQGAYWGLMAGLLTGLIRMILDFIYIEPACGEEDTRPAIVKDVNKLIIILIISNH